MRFLRWLPQRVGGRKIPFYRLDDELEANSLGYLYVNVTKHLLFKDIYNRCFRNAALNKNARSSTWEKVGKVYDAALKRMGIEEWDCPPVLLWLHKTSTVMKIPFERTDIIGEFSRLCLGDAESKLRDAVKLQTKGIKAAKGKELVCQGILPCKDGEHRYGFFLGKDPDVPGKARHPRYYCWLTNINKHHRLAILHALTGAAWVEIDLINAVPQGICRMAGCPKSLARIAKNTFLSPAPAQREKEKRILSPDTFRLLSDKVHGMDKGEAAENLMQFFPDCLDEWSRYVCTVQQMVNVHDLFGIEEVMRRFLLGHPYALNIHDATFLPANRVEDIEELIAVLEEESIHFKVSLHKGIDTQDITDNYKETLLKMNT